MTVWRRGVRKRPGDRGRGTSFYEEQYGPIIPISNQLLGVYALYEETSCVRTTASVCSSLISQMMMAVEREMLWPEQGQAGSK